MTRSRVPAKYLPIAKVYGKWLRAMTAAHVAIAQVEAGSEDWQVIKRAKDRLYKLVDAAAREAPLSYKDPAVGALLAELEALPSIEAATLRGRDARDKARQQELRRLREEEREAQRPYAWMKR